VIGKAEGEKLTATQKLEQKEIIIIIIKKKRGSKDHRFETIIFHSNETMNFRNPQCLIDQSYSHLRKFHKYSSP
jgi:hypothetical protein